MGSYEHTPEIPAIPEFPNLQVSGFISAVRHFFSWMNNRRTVPDGYGQRVGSFDQFAALPWTEDDSLSTGRKSTEKRRGVFFTTTSMAAMASTCPPHRMPNAG
jgi:hypothetical protein